MREEENLYVGFQDEAGMRAEQARGRGARAICTHPTHLI